MSRLDIAERRKAQDGAITLKVDEKEVDFRVSCMPTSFGERVVMRILRYRWYRPFYRKTRVS